MRPFSNRGACAGIVFALLLSCDSAKPAPPRAQTRGPSTSATGSSLQHPALGPGEVRIPQPFTMEQRLLDAVSRGDRHTIVRAMDKGATLAAKDDIGRSVVLLAVLDADSLDLVQWLHGKGAALDEPDSGGRTALSFAAANGRLAIVRYLVENGAAVDRADVQARTPLFHAALGNHPDVVAFLVDRGAQINSRDQFGDTPLIVACSKGYGETAALLLQRGADATLKDQEGRTARQRAAAGTEACVGSGAPPP